MHYPKHSTSGRLCLGKLGKLQNAIDACDDVILRFESIDSHELDLAVAIALCTRGMILECNG